MEKTESEILTLDEACEFLRITRKTLCKLTSKNIIPGRKLGKQWRFMKSILIDWLKNMKNRQRPCYEIKNCSDKEKAECEVYTRYHEKTKSNF